MSSNPRSRVAFRKPPLLPYFFVSVHTRIVIYSESLSSNPPSRFGAAGVDVNKHRAFVLITFSSPCGWMIASPVKEPSQTWGSYYAAELVFDTRPHKIDVVVDASQNRCGGRSIHRSPSASTLKRFNSCRMSSDNFMNPSIEVPIDAAADASRTATQPNTGSDGKNQRVASN
jgi:hypothetical protein